MRSLGFIVFVILFLFVLDAYLWWSLKKTLYMGWYRWLIPLSSLILLTSFYFVFKRAGEGGHNAIYSLNFIVGLTFGIVIAKILMVTVFFVEDVVRVALYVGEQFSSRGHTELAGRRAFVRNLSLAVASVPLAGTLWGITRGKYHYMTNRMDLYFEDLPEAFDGFKVIQFTDFHAGTFDHPSEVARGLELLQKEEGDVIVFTGDAVNNRSEELEPFVYMWKRLHAKYGKFSILGNHDYGHYISWDSETDRIENLQKLFDYQKEAGFDLLRNQHRVIEKEGSKLALIGVENWGNPPFPQYGDLDKAMDGVPADCFKILLSHDPDHWEKVRQHPEKIGLTLSGHTHGAQFGVDIPGWKWSPIKYRYKRWLGLYDEDERYLYVNRGFGFLGFPGRVGMRPEISVFTLRKGVRKSI